MIAGGGVGGGGGGPPLPPRPRPPPENSSTGGVAFAAGVGLVGAGAAAGCIAGGVEGCGVDGAGVFDGAAAAGAVAAGAGDETEPDFGAHAATIIPAASVAKTRGLTIRTPFAKKKRMENYCGACFSRLSSIFCMRSISVD